VYAHARAGGRKPATVTRGAAAGMRRSHQWAFLKRLHERVASVAIGPSTIRGMGPPGTVQRARTFLAKVRLGRFKVTSKRAFERELDRTTKAYLASLPSGARHWGMARKTLNIFLRDVAYNRFLNAAHRLDQVHKWLEVPLDSHVGNELRDCPEGEALPRWKTVIGLTPEASAEFQVVARKVAVRMQVNPVDLDVFFWRSPAALARVRGLSRTHGPRGRGR